MVVWVNDRIGMVVSVGDDVAENFREVINTEASGKTKRTKGIGPRTKSEVKGKRVRLSTLINFVLNGNPNTLSGRKVVHI